MNNQINYSFFKKFSAAFTAVFLAGCALLPAKDAAPVLATPLPTDFASNGSSNADWPTVTWWQSFNDDQLNALMQQALANSPSLAVERARIDQATALASETNANGGLALSLDGQASRQRYPVGSIYPPPLAGSYKSSGRLDLNLSYDFDFWGRNRSAFEAALGQRAAARADAEAAATALTSAVAKVYFQWQALDARIKIIDAVEHDRMTLVEIEAKRIKAGLAPGENLHPLTADAAAPDQTRVQLETQREQARYQLQSLTGGHVLPMLNEYPLPKIAIGIPADLHLDLLARRPDVAAARDRVAASLKQVDSARAAFYPDFSLSAFLQVSTAWISVRCCARPAVSKESLRRCIYRSSMPAACVPISTAGVPMSSWPPLNTMRPCKLAVADANDAMVHLDGITREAPSLRNQIQARRHALEVANQRARAGLADKRELLRDQLSLHALEEQEIVRSAQALSAQVDLIKALGGGYETSHAQLAQQTN